MDFFFQCLCSLKEVVVNFDKLPVNTEQTHVRNSPNMEEFSYNAPLYAMLPYGVEIKAATADQF